jgi:fatty acid desaturase
MGKGGKKEQESSNADLLIDGKIYDVTNFIEKHPGGSVIKFYAGKDIDASQAFNQFHCRSKTAKNIMKQYLKRDVTNKEMVEKYVNNQALLNDFDKLNQDLHNEGYFKPDISHVVYRCLEIFAMHIIGLYLLLAVEEKYMKGLGIMILGIVCGRCGWLMHEGGHYSLTGSIKFDRALQIFFYGVGCGMSGSWWRSQHNRHHSMPQKIGHDVDLETLPLVLFSKNALRKRLGIPMKMWIKFQAAAFPIITTLLVALGWQFYLHPRHIIRKRHVAEGLSFIARYALWHTFITSKFGIQNSILIYLAYTWFAANYIFLNFAVSHTHLATVPKEDSKVDWVIYAAKHTMNVHPGPLKFVSWWMSYLNFQIEHHLFPSMPQYRHPKISNRVRELFNKHGLVYDQRDYITAMKDTFANLDKVGSDVYLG